MLLKIRPLLVAGSSVARALERPDTSKPNPRRFVCALERIRTQPPHASLLSSRHGYFLHALLPASSGRSVTETAIELAVQRCPPAIGADAPGFGQSDYHLPRSITSTAWLLGSARSHVPTTNGKAY